MIASPSVGVKIFSVTGALVADYYSNTKNNDGLSVKVKDKKIGGVDIAEITLTNNIEDPLFTDMECQIFIDGNHWFSCYVETLPEPDNTEASITLIGKGFWHKLKTVIVNESYTSQTLDFIIKDVASSYLGADLNVFYDVAKITTPSVSGLTLEFKDKPLNSVLKTLLDICNADYLNAQYRTFVDKDKYLNFTLISTDLMGAYFEGWDYQFPEVETVKDKLVNKILTYRTISGNDNEVEYVATYQDADSIANYGTAERKLTLSDYMIAAGVSDIADGIISRYKDPITKLGIDDLVVDAVKDFGLYRLSNQRKRFLKTITSLETLTGWDVSNLTATTPTISSTEVFTNRKSLKLVTAVGSENDYMFFDLPFTLYFPQDLKFFSYRTNAGAMYTIRVSDTFGNTVDIPVGHNNEPINEWIKYTVRIDIELGTGTLVVDKDVSNNGPLLLDLDITTSGTAKVDFLISDGLLNMTKVDIIVDSDIVATSYFDQIDATVAAFNTHELILEEIEYTLNQSYTANLVLGDTVDSIVDEILDGNTEGQSALAIFSKQ